MDSFVYVNKVLQTFYATFDSSVQYMKIRYVRRKMIKSSVKSLMVWYILYEAIYTFASYLQIQYTCCRTIKKGTKL